MALRIDDVNETVTFTFENQKIETRAGDTVAAALVMTQQYHLRDSVVSGDPRGVYCMMGTCFECLVEIDGQPSVQACQTIARDGMIVCRQKNKGADQ